jgi:hypothetical protein
MHVHAVTFSPLAVTLHSYEIGMYSESKKGLRWGKPLWVLLYFLQRLCYRPFKPQILKIENIMQVGSLSLQALNRT